MVVFDKNWFLRHQKTLLQIVNTRWGKWFFRIHRDVPAGKRIVRILPNCYTWMNDPETQLPLSPSLVKRGKPTGRGRLIPGKPRITYTTDFRTHDKFGKRLYYGLKPVWYTLHYIDSVFAWLDNMIERAVPANCRGAIPSLQFSRLNFGFDTLTAYPAAGANSPVDGRVQRIIASGETFDTIRSGNGTNAYNTDSAIDFAYLRGYSSSNLYDVLNRGIFCFDTSTLGDGAAIDSAELSLFGGGKNNLLGSFTFSLVGASPSSTTALVASDFSALGNVRMATDISYAAFSTSAYNLMSLNTNGVNNISKSGISKFGTRLGIDIDGGTPGWVSGGVSYFSGYYADYAGTSQDPKLVITYTYPFFPTLTDSATLSDEIGLQAGKALDDSASLSDVIATKLATPFDFEAAKKTGITPVWILKCPFATGILYLSDRTFTVPSWNGGITTKPWISTWNAIDEDISGEMAMTKTSDLSFDMRIDPNAATDVQDILWSGSNNIETTDCELYLWFEGLDASADPPRLMWVGNIHDHEKFDELLVRVDFVDQSVRIDKYVGNKTDLAAYPSCDPDDVGKIAPIIYGSVTKAPTLIVDAGAQTSLPSSISAVATAFDVSDGSRLAAGKVIQIDDEQIYIISISGDTITNCTRGYNSTLGATHWRGASVWEKKTQFVYLWADHAVKSIGKIYGKVGQAELDITAICTKYTGQAGNQLAGYGARAVITVPGYITVEQAVDLLLSDGIDVNDAIAVVDSIAVNDTISVNDTIAVSDTAITDNIGATDNIGISVAGSNKIVYPTGGTYPEIYDGNETSAHLANLQTATFPSTNYGTITTQYIWAKLGATTNAISVLGGWSPSPITISTPGWYRFSKSGGSWDDSVQFYHVSETFLVYEVRKEVVYTADTSKSGAAYRTGANISKSAASKTGSASKSGGASKSGAASKSGSATKTGTVTLYGNSVANTLVGDEILISGEGHQDDASGTYTGTANALIERPDHVIKHLLAAYGGWAVANFYTNSGASFASKNYKFAGVISEYRRLKEWLAYLSFQCRCYFRFAEGKAQLLYRPDAITSSRTITKNMIRMDGGTRKTTLRGPRPSPLADVINKINLHFDRDWDQTGDTAYKGISKDSNSASITKYGEKEKPELFYFDFVTSQTMADDLRAFYLTRYKDRKKDFNMEVFLDNIDAKFADGVTITPAGGLLTEVQKVNIYPGSGRDKRNDRITLHVREY